LTDAVDRLFHPPPPGADEPHMITLGRRLNPSLAVPRPVAPVIQPREIPESRAEVGRARHLWETAAAHFADLKHRWTQGSWKERLPIAARCVAYAIGGYLALVLVAIALFRFVNPPGSMLMLTKLLGGTAVHRTWVPLESISPALVRAVVVSEDGRFCEHHGIDTMAMIEAIRQSGDGTPRGASTISMQVVKNLFLWSSKSYVRKVIEIPLTLYMELLWPKWRILEVYLNIAEWGPGVFGAEAAARHHFSKHASALTAREAALLAATLPNPIDRVASDPGPRTSGKARVVQARVKAYGAVASCVIAAMAADEGSPASVRPATVRKQPPRPAAQRKKKPDDDWQPSLKLEF
jgi:monofunctional biosynthetic peptidoglycan transglycosylase